MDDWREAVWRAVPEGAEPERFAERRAFLLDRVAPGARVLDLGCGDGAFAAALLAHNNLLGFPYRHGFTVAALTRLLESLGFEIVSTYGDTLVPIADRGADALNSSVREVPTKNRPTPYAP